MNDLSWLLYWADVLPSLSVAVITLSLIGALFFFALWICNVADNNHDPETQALFRRFVFVWPACLLLSCLSFLVPSKETFYLIAASEVGETAVKTEEFVKLRRLLNDWLDSQLEDGKHEDDS